MNITRFMANVLKRGIVEVEGEQLLQIARQVEAGGGGQYRFLEGLIDNDLHEVGDYLQDLGYTTGAALEALWAGNYDSLDEYIRVNAYGNIESVSEFMLQEEAEEARAVILEDMEAYGKDGGDLLMFIGYDYVGYKLLEEAADNVGLDVDGLEAWLEGLSDNSVEIALDLMIEMLAASQGFYDRLLQALRDNPEKEEE